MGELKWTQKPVSWRTKGAVHQSVVGIGAQDTRYPGKREDTLRARNFFSGWPQAQQCRSNYAWGPNRKWPGTIRDPQQSAIEPGLGHVPLNRLGLPSE